MSRRACIVFGSFCSKIGLSALAAALCTVAALPACSRTAPAPPDAEFLVATPDSTFWVHTGSQGIRIKAVPMTLAHFGGRFHEVFVADLDRSFDDAIFTGERVYVRDLQTNDSSLVYDDTAIIAIAARHARTYPDAAPLEPGDDTPTSPDITATGETDILQIRGPYALLEHRVEYDMPAGDQHDTVHTAVDLRTGAAATPEAMARDSATEDANLVSRVPRTWARKGYALNARGIDDGSVLLTLYDRSHDSWELLRVSAHPRVYWLDNPPISAASRRALMRAFNSAAAYDESVKYVDYLRRLPVPPLHPAHHA